MIQSVQAGIEMMWFWGWKVKVQGHMVNKCIYLHTNDYYACVNAYLMTTAIQCGFKLYECFLVQIHTLHMQNCWNPTLSCGLGTCLQYNVLLSNSFSTLQKSLPKNCPFHDFQFHCDRILTHLPYSTHSHTCHTVHTHTPATHSHSSRHAHSASNGHSSMWTLG